MNPTGSRLATFLLVLWIASSPSFAESSGADCKIQVNEPQSGKDVGSEVVVKGTAKLPPNHHLWVFTRCDTYRSDGLWWLQPEGLPDPKTGRWEVIASIGEEHDIGRDFDIAVAVFDQREHLLLRERRRKDLTNKGSSLIEMPAAAPTCSPVVRVVSKKSHS